MFNEASMVPRIFGKKRTIISYQPPLPFQQGFVNIPLSVVFLLILFFICLDIL